MTSPRSSNEKVIETEVGTLVFQTILKHAVSDAVLEVEDIRITIQVQKLVPNQLTKAMCVSLPKSIFSDIMLVILKLAVVGKFTPGEWANATNHSFPIPYSQF